MYKKNKSKTIYINLRGGLGNQLFCYFFGQRMIKDNNVRVKYLYYSGSNPHHRSNSKINSFKLNHGIIKVKGFHFFMIAIRLFLSTFFKGVFSEKFSSYSQKSSAELLFSDIYDETFTEYSEQILLINKWISETKSRNLYVRGLFQDFKYFESCLANDLALAQPSNKYKNLLKEILDVTPIIVHVRLGDYLGELDTLGVLNHIYYQTAIKMAQDEFPMKEVWIFSNQPGLALKLLGAKLGGKIRFITEADISDPAETLFLMSLGIALITSNSTFSLWSAKLSKKSNLIIVPKPFFKDFYFNVVNYDQSWTLISSRWLSNTDLQKF